MYIYIRLCLCLSLYLSVCLCLAFCFLSGFSAFICSLTLKVAVAGICFLRILVELCKLLLSVVLCVAVLLLLFSVLMYSHLIFTDWLQAWSKSLLCLTDGRAFQLLITLRLKKFFHTFLLSYIFVLQCFSVLPHISIHRCAFLDVVG